MQRRTAALVTLFLASCGDPAIGPDAQPPLTVDGELEISLEFRIDPGEVTMFATGIDGAIGEPVTGANGSIVPLGVQSGGSVTLLAYDASRLYTFLAVEPGDLLRVGVAPPIDTEVRPSIKVRWPDIGAAEYRVASSCGMDQVEPDGIRALFRSGCEPSDDTDLVVFAEDARGEPIASAFLENAPLGTDVTVPAWLPPETFTVTLTDAELVDSYTIGASGMVRAGGAVYISAEATVETPGQTTFSATDTWVQTSEVAVGARFSRFAEQGVGHYRREYISGDAREWTFDANDTLPSIDDLEREGWHRLNWTEEADGDEPDGTSAFLQWGTGADTGMWWIIGPYTGPGLDLPGLPLSVFPGFTGSGEGFQIHVSYEDFEIDVDDEDFRARPTWEHLWLGTFTEPVRIAPYRATHAYAFN